MKTTRFISAVCILTGIILLGGCEKSGIGQGGKAVRFTASAESKGLTKTSYTGQGTFTDGFLTWERIDWEATDVIRVASNYAYIQDPGDGGLTAGIHYADYRVSNITTSSDKKKSLADMAPYAKDEITGIGSNGLIWDDAHDSGYAFYAVYPCPFLTSTTEKDYISLGSGDESTTLGQVTAFLPVAQTLKTGTDTPDDPSDDPITRYVASNGAVADANGLFTEAQTDGYTYSVYQPDMEYAFMTAATTGVAAHTEGVTLSFSPAYTAFEFCITNQDDADLTLNSISLTAAGENDYLSGEYSFTAGGLTDVAVNTTATGDRAAGKTVSMALGDNGLTVDQSNGVALTLFAVPKANTGVISLRIVNSEGTATLELKSGGNPVVFNAGEKYRINLLKIGGRWKYKIVLTPDDLPWDKVEESTTFSQNIQSGPFTIENATETGNHYYPDGTKDYQVRTLDMSKDYGHTTVNGESVPNKPFFLVTFKPMAPLGGYWQLIPESNAGMGTAAFKVEVWDTDTNEGSPDLKGQIMNQTITLHITCNVTDDQRTEDHAIIIKSLFSTSVTFDENSTYSADSEIQDAHKDGSFSYWRFVIPAKVN